MDLQRFEDALTQMSKLSVGPDGNYYAYMTGYLISLVNELGYSNHQAEIMLKRATQSVEELLFAKSTARELDILE